jgi:soluble lytic murein transglycosylase-like protein
MAGALPAFFLLLTALLSSGVAPAAAETATPPAAIDARATTEPASLVDKICPTIGREASLNELPVEFFTRLIWQESRFNPKARSHKGAEGIAQFMPGTARWRGLADSYEPLQALRESARWLGELREQFGNLGLANATKATERRVPYRRG